MIKHLEEYRDASLIEGLIRDIHKITTKPWNIMEICGGQTHSLVKNGILELLPKNITMIHGPGCPVCVTPESIIDAAIEVAFKERVTLCTYGDMIRVPGKDMSLQSAKSRGASVNIVYSPLDAVKIAQENPDIEVVFLAVGFETTAPAHAISILQAKELGISNFSMLQSHVLVPPAMKAILSDEDCHVDGFLAAGHVCTITGIQDYHSIAEDFKTPIVATGFEPVDLLHGIKRCVELLQNENPKVEISYSRAVREGGNQNAVHVVDAVFQSGDKEWRGLGLIPQSGLAFRKEFKDFDASQKFNLSLAPSEDNECIAGEILKGIKKPPECPFFGSVCTPENPKGAPMVSNEGACSAYYYYNEEQIA